MKDDFELLRGLANCADKEQMMRYIEEHQPKPMTNGDKIRAMTDEELEDFIREVYDTGSKSAEAWYCGEGHRHGFEWSEDWLKQPVEVDNWQTKQEEPRKSCIDCENDGFDMPQCKHCNPGNDFMYFSRKKV